MWQEKQQPEFWRFTSSSLCYYPCFLVCTRKTSVVSDTILSHWMQGGILPHSSCYCRRFTPSVCHCRGSGLKVVILPLVWCPQATHALARNFSFILSALWHPHPFGFCWHCIMSEVSALNSVRPRKKRGNLSKAWGKGSRNTTSPSLPHFPSPPAIQALLRKQSYSFFTNFLLHTMTAFSQ